MGRRGWSMTLCVAEHQAIDERINGKGEAHGVAFAAGHGAGTGTASL